MKKIFKYIDLGIYYFGYVLFLIGIIKATHDIYEFIYEYDYISNKRILEFSLTFISLTVTGVYFIRSYKKD